MDIEKALLLPWWHAMSVPPDLQQIIIPISALPFIWHYCLWKGAWSVAVTSFIYGCVGAHFLKLAPFRWEPCSGCAWLCSVVGKGWGTARVVCAPTASESFMQPFSHTFAQDLLAGHCLTMHSCSYGTTLNGDMRLLHRATMPRKTETPPARLPMAWRPADLGVDSHLLFHSASGPCAGGGCLISGGFPWTEVWLASPTAGCSPWWVVGQTADLQKSLPAVALLCFYCLFIPGLSQSRSSCKVSLDNHCSSCQFLVGLGFYPSEVLLLKKPFLLLEFCHNIWINHTLHRCFWSWILTFLTC